MNTFFIYILVKIQDPNCSTQISLMP